MQSLCHFLDHCSNNTVVHDQMDYCWWHCPSSGYFHHLGFTIGLVYHFSTSSGSKQTLKNVLLLISSFPKNWGLDKCAQCRDLTLDHHM